MMKLKLLETIKELLIMQRKIEFMQTVYLLIINMLVIKPLALPLAKNQTLVFSFLNCRLRVDLMCKRLIKYISLFVSKLKFYRLQYRLQKSQLSPLTSLQVQAISFAVYKENSIENQKVNKTFFAHLFANNSN